MIAVASATPIAVETPKVTPTMPAAVPLLAPAELTCSVEIEVSWTPTAEPRSTSPKSRTGLMCARIPISTVMQPTPSSTIPATTGSRYLPRFTSPAPNGLVTITAIVAPRSSTAASMVFRPLTVWR
uniref:Unannotated protein n=1 Tax=freshwater metagenome TaxID=449393 RepID=A0A6J5ZSW3_9ZZZZ